ncbi:DEAD/DEAH box helicase [bacterium]|nr:DEAD/DEAH box helicase [bacterium]
MPDALKQFHPVVAEWFTKQIGTPTDIQAQSWPVIATMRHVLITAPTGSGKTLTAFLWALNQLATGTWEHGKTSVLYISPLKALNNDIHRNLITPLEGLAKAFRDAGQDFPDIRVLTRSGDTPQKDRQRMLKKPPEILITTPESLNIMLTSDGGRSMLTGIKAVILDEIHAVIGSKRGTWLMTGVDRLVPLSGEFQRIGLSATIRPMDTVAAFLGGNTINMQDENPVYTARPVEIICSNIEKKYDIKICFPDGSDQPAEGEAFWHPLIASFKEIAARNKSTLFFVRGRRMSEKMTLKMNLDEDPPVAYAHHGSLSKEIRLEVERRLKRGSLRAIVATNSLELGIDIGDLDEVVLIQTPPSVSSAVQRVGRAGHQVGETSKATIFPTYNQDFLVAAALLPEILHGRIEPVHPVEQPLDVLAQIIVSMVSSEVWTLDELYNFLRCSWPYRLLNRKIFDLVVQMLGGRYEGLRIRELKARVSIDDIAGTIQATSGARMALYASGGVIPDRGNYHLRRADSRAHIGELDEEFVWEAKIGQTFIFGTQRWTIEKITHNDVLVRPGDPRSTATPFWRGDLPARDTHFSTIIGEFLEWVEHNIDHEEFAMRLATERHMDTAAAEHLAAFLKRQRDRTKVPLPHRHHVLVEHVESGPGGAPGRQLVIHTLWGGKINGPMSIALQAAWEKVYGYPLEVFPTDDAVVMQLPHDDITGRELFDLLINNDIESLLRHKLESSGLFGAQFRECAGRALLIERQSLRKRLPLWMSRLKSQKLMAAIGKLDDFPILLETWRSCLRDVFDLPALKERLAGIESGSIRIGECTTPIASPMAHDATYDQINKYMYETDEPGGAQPSALHDDLIRQVALDPLLRPQIPQNVIVDFEARRQRLAPGYSPSSANDLVDYVRERWVLTEVEWDILVEAMHRDHGEDASVWIDEAEDRLLPIMPEHAKLPLITTREAWPLLTNAFQHYWGKVVTDPPYIESVLPKFDIAAIDIFAEWLSFYGPVKIESIQSFWGLPQEEVTEMLIDLEDSGRLIKDNLNADHHITVCEAETFEILLRMTRLAGRPELVPLPATALPFFLAQKQGLILPGHSEADLEKRLDALLGFAAPAAHWETEILPARIHIDTHRMMDGLLSETGLIWMGTGEKTLSLIFENDRELITEHSAKEADVSTLFPDANGRYDIMSIAANSGQSVNVVTSQLWKAAWQGSVTTDTMAPLRKGITTKFKSPDIARPEVPGRLHSSRRMRFDRWKGSLPISGHWRLLPPIHTVDDPVSHQELNRDRVRLLLDRYGILFKGLLDRELPLLRWSALFRTLRLMELSGEIVSGQFFEGISGLQFAAPETVTLFQEKIDDKAVYWMNATDPASPCALPIKGLRENLPRRVDSNYLVFRGAELILISQRKGRDLKINIDIDDPDISRAFAPLHHLLQRHLKPVHRIVIESINGEDAAKSEYAAAIKARFETQADHRYLTLYRKIQ